MVALIIAGLPASGKGTQCKLIASEFGLVHLDTGENLRREIKMETDLGVEARKYISEGKLVPDSLIKQLTGRILELYPSGQGFVFDGFPRTVQQAKILEEFGEKLNLEIKGMFFLEIDREEITRRIQKRAKQEVRKDDQDPDIIRKRIEAQSSQMNDLKSFFSERDKFFPINGEGKIEEVFERIKRIIENKELIKA